MIHLEEYVIKQFLVKCVVLKVILQTDKMKKENGKVNIIISVSLFYSFVVYAWAVYQMMILLINSECTMLLM